MAIPGFRVSIPGMTERSRVLDMETMFLALADRTRLRLLNLMADEEVCVNYFTEALRESQPKVSRHLAYLRNAGLVDTRRQGKWIYYSIYRPDDDSLGSVLDATISVLADDAELRSDKARLAELNAGRKRLSTDALAPAEIAGYYKPQRPVRPVHNELDEYLL
jgi:ArsR family transcriptional regulator, arsenate/arsenite/antimonite-responsive transcriptional repressor